MFKKIFFGISTVAMLLAFSVTAFGATEIVGIDPCFIYKHIVAK